MISMSPFQGFGVCLVVLSQGCALLALGFDVSPLSGLVMLVLYSSLEHF